MSKIRWIIILLLFVSVSLIIGGKGCLWTNDDDETVTGSSAASSLVPNKPLSLEAVAVSAFQINLSWNDISDDESGFKIERKTGIGGTYGIVAVVSTNVNPIKSSLPIRAPSKL